MSMKTRYCPMQANIANRPFSGDDWIFEIKWDGIRALAYINGSVSLVSRNGVELSGRFPELRELAGLAPGTVLDGEIIVMRDGIPDIQSLLPRLQSKKGPGARSLPVTYIVFDILEKDGEPLVSLPLARRREILESSVREGPHVVLSRPVESRGEDYYRAAVAQGLEGIMAKRKDSPYEPGKRGSSWLKIRIGQTCDCIIAGFTPGRRGRSPFFGSLLLALYDNRGAPVDSDGAKLRYIGKVGTGFNEKDLAGLKKLFARYTSDAPQVEETGEKNVIWLEPALVCEVEYQQVTGDLKLRIPRFRRIRSDKRPEECTTDQIRSRAEGIPPGPEQHPSLRNPVRKNAYGKEVPVPAVSKNGTFGKVHRPVSSPGEMNGDRQTRQAGRKATERYHEKRNFQTTPEPEGLAIMTGSTFVVQEHHARRLHYDLRLERDGVLKSWAVPKGVPETPGAKHLAVAVEDHPLEYATFEGTIPEGDYGAGTVTVWDSGTYETKHWDENKIEVSLHGKRLDGLYVLVRFRRAGKNEWLIFRAEG